MMVDKYTFANEVAIQYFGSQESSIMDSCEKYGMMWSCDINCPVLRMGKCQNKNDECKDLYNEVIELELYNGEPIVGQIYDFPRWDGDDNWGDRIVILEDLKDGRYLVKSFYQNKEFLLKKENICCEGLIAEYPTWQEAVNCLKTYYKGMDK